VLVYDITSKSSFEELDVFIELIDKVFEDGVPMVLVGNKCDLEEEREVEKQEGEERAKELRCDFMEVSAKEGLNIDETFIKLITSIRGIEKETTTEKVEKEKKEKPKKIKKGLFSSISNSDDTEFKY
jgi:GTPase SAR1 family protein